MNIFLVFVIPVVLLIAVSLLFMKRRPGTNDWPMRLAVSIVCALGVFAAWLWQYTKFLDKHGFFYLISPDYGWILLTAIDVIFLMALIPVVWKESGE